MQPESNQVFRGVFVDEHAGGAGANSTVADRRPPKRPILCRQRHHCDKRTQMAIDDRPSGKYHEQRGDLHQPALPK